jgi:hypothetical protein
MLTQSIHLSKILYKKDTEFRTFYNTSIANIYDDVHVIIVRSNSHIIFDEYNMHNTDDLAENFNSIETYLKTGRKNK